MNHHEDQQRQRALALLKLAFDRLPPNGEATLRIRRDRSGALVVDRPELRATLDLYEELVK